MLALVSAALLVASPVSAGAVVDSPASVVNYFGVEDITPTPAPGTGYAIIGEAKLTLGTRTVTYDLAGRKSNGDLVFASPRTSGVKKWNWYSTGMFDANSVVWF